MKKTILIVDDVILNIDVLTSFLHQDYAIMAAINGESAIKILERKKPDLVLLDLYMPGIDGFDVLQFIKSREELASIPVIFVTGEHDIDSEGRCIAMGAVDYIKKPYIASIVKAKVKNHLELKTYRDNLEYLVFERTKELEERTKQLAASREAIILSMSLMSESRDRVTGQHIERIKSFTKILCDKLLTLYPDFLTPDLAEQIVLYSPLHDLGKISTPDSILHKEGSLTHDEFEAMKDHTRNAADLLRKTEIFYSEKGSSHLNIAIDIAEGHHERFDGSGYPYGLKGNEIPISARVVALADVYDALRSSRPYKKAFSHEKATEIITIGDGRTMPEHFDPRVLNAFKVANLEFSKVFV